MRIVARFWWEFVPAACQHAPLTRRLVFRAVVWQASQLSTSQADLQRLEAEVEEVCPLAVLCRGLPVNLWAFCVQLLSRPTPPPVAATRNIWKARNQRIEPPPATSSVSASSTPRIARSGRNVFMLSLALGRCSRLWSRDAAGSMPPARVRSFSGVSFASDGSPTSQISKVDEPFHDARIATLTAQVTRLQYEKADVEAKLKGTKLKLRNAEEALGRLSAQSSPDTVQELKSLGVAPLPSPIVHPAGDVGLEEEKPLHLSDVKVGKHCYCFIRLVCLSFLAVF